MNPWLRLALVAVLVWQAVAGGWRLCGAAWAGRGRGYVERLTAGEDARLRAALGPDYALYCALRDDLPADAWVLTRTPAAGTLEDAGRVQTLSALRNLLYPHPFLQKSMPDPVATAEARAQPGQRLWLLALPGDPEPGGRRGWTCQRREERFRLWRFER